MLVKEESDRWRCFLLQTDGDGDQRDEPDGVLTVFGIVAWIDQLVEVTADETTTVLSLTKAL